MPQQPNMQQLLKQAQKMQQDMLAAQESLKDEVVEASAGGSRSATSSVTTRRSPRASRCSQAKSSCDAS